MIRFIAIIPVLDLRQLYMLTIIGQTVEHFLQKYRGATVWNTPPDTLPVDLKDTKSHKTFKNSLKVYIQNELFLNNWTSKY